MKLLIPKQVMRALLVVVMLLTSACTEHSVGTAAAGGRAPKPRPSTGHLAINQVCLSGVAYWLYRGVRGAALTPRYDVYGNLEGCDSGSKTD